MDRDFPQNWMWSEACEMLARAGIKRVMLPARNQKDYEDIPDDARTGLEFVWLERVDEAVAAALEAPPADRDTPSARRSQPVASDAAA